MARRRSYSRRNQLDDTELIIGGVIGVAVLGVVGYLIYKNTQTTAAASALPVASAASQFGTANPLQPGAISASSYASPSDYFGTINPYPTAG